MSNLLYLVLAVAFSAVGITILWFRTRRPRSMTAHIEEFARELDALAPERQRRRATRERPSG